MSEVKEPTSQAISLYLAQEQKIEALRSEIAKMNNALSEYVRRLEIVDTNGKRTHERQEQGVSPTATKALDKVKEIETALSEVNGHLKNTDTIVGTHSERLLRSEKFDSQVLIGMLITVFLSVFTTVIVFLWNFHGHL